MASEHHGVVYTREWVVRFILDLAGYRSDKPLHNLTICEPSCGEGSFLNVIVDRLAGSAVDNDCFDVESLRDCVVAYDLDPLSVQTAQSSVVTILENHGMNSKNAIDLANCWIQNEDYLLSGNHACDYVIGNPPYLRATEIERSARDEYCARISSMTRGCDIFVGFIQRGLEDLKPDGSLVYICADRWLQNQYGRKLRGYLVDNGFFINALIRMYGVDAFADVVDAYPSITQITRHPSDLKYVDCSSAFSANEVPQILDWLENGTLDIDEPLFSTTRMQQPNSDSVVPLASPARVRLVQDLMSRYPSLEDAGTKIGIGLATGRDDVFIVDNPDVAEHDRMLPAFNMRDVRRHINKNRWLVNPWKRDNTLVDLDDYPRLKTYFEEHKEDLARRHVARRGDWYRTIDKPNWSLLGKPMLLFPDMAMKADPILSDGSKYPCHNCYWLISERWDLEALGGLLMSDTAEAFVDALGVKMRGGTLRFQAQYLRLIHVPEPETIPTETIEALRIAFRDRDREAASKAAAKAYRLEA